MNDQYGPVTSWLAEMPKAELHLHIDGTLRPERLLALARKNGVELPYETVEEVEAAYDFSDLQSFLDLYYLGASVLRDADDFYWLMKDYLDVCKREHIVHCEIMVEPQTYAPYGVDLSVVMDGFRKAIAEAHSDCGQSVVLILSFLRHLPEQDCLDTLALADEFRQDFHAIGLASSERDFPPEGFLRLYSEAAKRGYALAAHAGEEGTAAYVRTALDELGATRIDHGVRSSDDPELMQDLIDQQIPLTVCPLSNVRLCVYPHMSKHNILDMLEQRVRVTVNSDDPAYFGGYLLQNFAAMEDELGMTKAQALALVRNSFEAAYLTQEQRTGYLQELDRYCEERGFR
ncbi:MAG: adenosine deaminase [Pseudomonadota bacterium]